MRDAIIIIFFIFYFLIGAAAIEGKKRKSNDSKSEKNFTPSKTEIIKTVRKDVSNSINKSPTEDNYYSPAEIMPENFHPKKPKNNYRMVDKHTQMHKLGATWWQIKRSEDKLMDEDIPSHSKLAKDSRDDEKEWFN